MKKLIVLGALMMATTSAYASSDSLLYAGATLGKTTYGDNAGDDTMMGVRVGTGILPIVDIEAGYIKLGDVDVTGGGSAGIDTMYVVAKPTITLGIADVYAKVGMHKWKVDESGLKDDSTDFVYGLGADYYLSDRLSIGASYMIYKFDGDNIKDSDASVVAINATFHL